uniref:AlNc14C189G8420 protein n=1 Tax=Albugo laibachii Nc14 TaxID=890382 RepID=F0WPS8_9STRA|nr:AlNc14C189G8420 [Albugo laibachii Nc14]|eukprot:CCA23329.1 AlNc14C189G8420 [Albugo laibachii Nc14]
MSDLVPPTHRYMYMYGFNWLKPIIQKASVGRTNDDILPYLSEDLTEVIHSDLEI